MKNTKGADTPLQIGKRVDEHEERDESVLKITYRELVGSLLYLTNKTRPDMAFAVNYESRSLENPTKTDIENVKRTFKYLKVTENLGIRYKRISNLTLAAYTDSDYAGDLKTRKSTSGHVLMFCGGLVAWWSRKQPIVALSTTVAEHIAASECVKEVMYAKTFIEELVGKELSVRLHLDNQSTIRLIETGQLNRRSKHIDVRYHFISEKVSQKVLTLNYCPSQYIS
ncbi:secreted RxLR effector protein 161-like [Ischnura elegans]|uniref:secreted RxLR effector protein 161-like n=1 Tax=Ischnura elegans TaxID=197161 RepID=UPI001ED88509|nr:secreted RxLR effector protein 161-like [Ischnura elegans]